MLDTQVKVESVSFKDDVESKEKIKQFINEYNTSLKKSQGMLDKVNKLAELEYKITSEIQAAPKLLHALSHEYATIMHNGHQVKRTLYKLIDDLNHNNRVIDGVKYSIEEVVCPLNPKHNHSIIKIEVDEAKTVFMEMVYIADW